MTTKSPLLNKIEEGENQKQDFKHSITDSKKIARSLAAFANTDGGRLLIGIRDNGSIAGIKSDEEYHMVEAAAQMYCKPEVNFTSRKWQIQGKTVLEIKIPKSDHKPHSAPNKENVYRVYIRVKDQNLLANQVLLKVWDREKRLSGTYISFSKDEKHLLDYLENSAEISIGQFMKLVNIKRYQAIKTLVNLISIKLLKINFTEKRVTYSLADPQTFESNQEL